jgi:hypothetical protein
VAYIKYYFGPGAVFLADSYSRDPHEEVPSIQIKNVSNGTVTDDCNRNIKFISAAILVTSVKLV